MEADERKVIEILAGALPSKNEPDEDFVSLTLLDSDFQRNGLSIDIGTHILKHKLTDKGVVEVGQIRTCTPQDTDEEIDWGRYCVNCEVYSKIWTWLETKTELKDKVEFSFKDITLTINGKDISFGTLDRKQNAVYVLEYLFKQKDYSTYYADIHENNPIDQYKEDWRMYYRACVSIQLKIGKETGIGDFLVFGASRDSAVMINPKYLP